MEGIFIVLGVASLLYVIAIIMIHGLTSFLWFWPLFAAVQFLMFALVRYVRRKQREKKRIHPGPFVFIFTSYGLWMLVLLALLGTIFFNAHTVEQKTVLRDAGLDHVVVHDRRFGASIIIAPAAGQHEDGVRIFLRIRDGTVQTLLQ